MLVTMAVLAGVVGLLFAVSLWIAMREASSRRRRQLRAWTSTLEDMRDGRRGLRKRVDKLLASDRDLESFQEFLAEEMSTADGERSLALRHLSRTLGVTDRLEDRLRAIAQSLEAGHGRASPQLASGTCRAGRHGPPSGAHDPHVVMVAGYACADLEDPSLFVPVMHAVYRKTTITLHGPQRDAV